MPEITFKTPRKKKRPADEDKGDLLALRAWHVRMGYTVETGADALGMSRSGYGFLLADVSRIDRRTMFACRAIEMGLAPLEKIKPKRTRS